VNNLIALAIALAVTVLFLRRYLKQQQLRDIQAREAAEKGSVYSHGPRAQHPQIDTTLCMGCATCTTVCPEGDVLAMLGGQAVIINGHKCVGHSLCADACPVGAITMVMAKPGVNADLPHLSPEHETNIPNMFIVGELGGLALIKHAINQGRDCVDTIASRLPALRRKKPPADVFDLLIVGVGPGGISASLRASERKLNYLTVDEGEVGGTVYKYPRQKVVLTSPVELPVYGKFKKMELSKEDLLAVWNNVLGKIDFKFRKGERVEHIIKGDDEIFTVFTSKGHEYRALTVVLAMGKSGTARKLGVKGEELPKVMYRLIEADHYTNKKILVVGGGDSAVEAAMGLASQPGNKVTLSYRRSNFIRLKTRNQKRLEDMVSARKIDVIYNSIPVEFTPNSVILDAGGQRLEIPNDYAWIFAGGEPPTAFLKKIGIKVGMQDVTSESSKEANQALLVQT
jgi:thioredoxin reductase/Pyruvate/2-oxoacid:ferredoxin oxidoreductase delta subunit